MHDRRRHLRPATAALLLALAGCTVGPDYRKPDAPVPAAYKEKGWQQSEPSDAMDRGAWWSIYADPVLDGLVRQIDISNQNLRLAEANYRRARALVDQSRSQLFPVIGATGSATRQQAAGTNGAQGRIRNSFSATGTASWAPDLWGSIRRTIESDSAAAQASAAQLALARLSAQADLVTNYFELRAQDASIALLDASAVAYTQSLQIANNRYNAGIAARSDVASAETQLKSTQAQAINAKVRRAQLEHAIAVLIGRPPSELSIPATAFPRAVPDVPLDLPSTLLERRPDIAAAERQMAAANADIGIATAAFYPNVTLSASYGATSNVVSQLLDTASRVWSLGSSIAQTIFDFGTRSAQLEQARAAYEGTIASYRQTVLTAFQQVEDQLAAIRILEEQQAVVDDALRSAEEAERLTLNQYRAGTVAYTSVITAQTAALSNRQSALSVRLSRMAATAALIEALGGGWDTTRLPPRPADDPLP